MRHRDAPCAYHEKKKGLHAFACNPLIQLVVLVPLIGIELLGVEGELGRKVRSKVPSSFALLLFGSRSLSLAA